MKRVLLAGGGTGGHLMPALAIGSAVHAMHPDWRVVYAGARRGIEATVLPERHLPHHLLPLEPIYRQQWWKNVRWPFLLPGLIVRIDAMLDAEAPDVVVGTGGYVSGPVLWRAARRGIPTALLELDVRAGIATRLMAPRVREVWLATAETIASLPTGARARANVTGAPIVPPDPARRAEGARHFHIDGQRPVVVITGGSQGSLAINRVAAEWIRSGGSAGVQVLWATGRGSFAEFSSCERPPEVQVIPFIDPMANAWAVADLCVARAGMMTLSELCAWGIPSLLIPLPTAAADHQSHNARAMAATGAAVALPQAELTPQRFGDIIATLLAAPADRAAMRAAALARARPDAAIELAQRVSLLAG
ncbi:MAG TPA: UDP-N-acetylglucosamine--N-acetylmuramyl-(pentapeptide) pyrophosphoryl-undecaprenol N-acetylglucosamine transferase [Gemmatimonadales bacterium]|jgi:UDP-N-acetylglucosamine--N-acetylmuramyl-(pentapeptide) pyrophosphoryl-undecaprenol N-acetylglucosamine transferase